MGTAISLLDAYNPSRMPDLMDGRRVAGRSDAEPLPKQPFQEERAKSKQSHQNQQSKQQPSAFDHVASPLGYRSSREMTEMLKNARSASYPSTVALTRTFCRLTDGE